MFIYTRIWTISCAKVFNADIPKATLGSPWILTLIYSDTFSTWCICGISGFPYSKPSSNIQSLRGFRDFLSDAGAWHALCGRDPPLQRICAQARETGRGHGKDMPGLAI